MWTFWTMDCHLYLVFASTLSLTKSWFLCSSDSQLMEHQNSQVKIWTDALPGILKIFMRFGQQSQIPGNLSRQQKPSSTELIRECEILVHDSETFIDTVKGLEKKIDESKDSSSGFVKTAE